MLIYGSKTTQLAKENVTGNCPNCGTPNAVDLYVFQKYAHVFWIPLFPAGKVTLSQCTHCKQVLKPKEMSSALMDANNHLKAQSRTPVWTFTGLALIAVLITIGVINDKKNDERNAQLILAPKEGDIFEVKTKHNQYTLYKVASVTGESVFLYPNQYETNKLTGLDDLKRKGDNAYTEEALAVSIAELKQMLEKGEIMDIDRK